MQTNGAAGCLCDCAPVDPVRFAPGGLRRVGRSITHYRRLPSLALVISRQMASGSNADWPFRNGTMSAVEGYAFYSREAFSSRSAHTPYCRRFCIPGRSDMRLSGPDFRCVASHTGASNLDTTE